MLKMKANSEKIFALMRNILKEYIYNLTPNRFLKSIITKLIMLIE